MRKVLLERDFPVWSIKFLASERSAGKPIEYGGKRYVVEPIRPEAFAGVQIVLSSTPSKISREYGPLAARQGAIVVDNSSAWRMDPEVPLVVATYQSSSGKGATGLQDFEQQLGSWMRGEKVTPTAHRGQLAGNVITLDWTLDLNGYTEEENK